MEHVQNMAGGQQSRGRYSETTQSRDRPLRGGDWRCRYIAPSSQQEIHLEPQEVRSRMSAGWLDRLRALGAAGLVAIAACGDVSGAGTAASQLRVGTTVSTAEVSERMTAPSAVVALSAGTLRYFGGKVISRAKAYAINWNKNVNSQVLPKVASLYQAVLDSEYIDWLCEYNTMGPNGVALNGVVDGLPGSNQQIGRGTFGGAYILTPQVVGTSLNDQQIQQELSHQMDIGVLPPPDDDSYYAVNFPVNFSIFAPQAGHSCDDFCGYHGTFTRNGQEVYYAVLPSLQTAGCGGCVHGNWLDSTTATASHELAEAITDPEVGLSPFSLMRPLAWSGEITIGTPPDTIDELVETADLCQPLTGTITGHDGAQYTVQKLYDNATGSCIVSKRTQCETDGAACSSDSDCFNRYCDGGICQPGCAPDCHTCRGDVCGPRINNCGQTVQCDGTCPCMPTCSANSQCGEPDGCGGTCPGSCPGGSCEFDSEAFCGDVDIGQYFFCR